MDTIKRTLVSTIIPAKDEAAQIGALISRLGNRINGCSQEVIVIDDGSTDNTPVIAREKGVSVISHQRNMGKGAAMKTGAKNTHGDIIVFIDGDGAHMPQDIPSLIEPILKGEADIVNGSRLLPGSKVETSPFIRRLTNNLASFVISMIISCLIPLTSLLHRTGSLLGINRKNKSRASLKFRYIKITDCTSGFRAITRDAWNKLSLTSQGFEIETEMIYEAVRNGLVIKEIPISCNWDKSMSKLSIVGDGLRTMSLISKKLFYDIRGV